LRPTHRTTDLVGTVGQLIWRVLSVTFASVVVFVEEKRPHGQEETLLQGGPSVVWSEVWFRIPS
jgi:hypothetical protein